MDYLGMYNDLWEMTFRSNKFEDRTSAAYQEYRAELAEFRHYCFDAMAGYPLTGYLLATL